MGYTGVSNAQQAHEYCDMVRSIVAGTGCPTVAELFDAAQVAGVNASELLTPCAVPLPA